MESRLKPPQREDWAKMCVLWRDGLPRRQRGDKLDLLLFWRDEAADWLRRKCGDDYLVFEWYVMREAVRLIESATSCGQQ